MYSRQECDKLEGDFFPRTGDCLYKGGSFGRDPYPLNQPYYWMLGSVALLGLLFFRR